METVYTGLIFSLLLAVTAVPYWLKVRKHKNASENKFEKNAKAGILQPVTLHPHIDLNTCIGCSSCVQICPENVLGMVRGKAAIVSGMKCVGHSLCEEVCPVGAITLRFGTPGQGMEIPYYNDQYESNIENLYIVGELGGIGLIKNAVTQAVNAVMDIVGKGKREHSLEYDLLIIGAGPAGLAAALAAQEQQLRYAVLEQDEVGGSILHYPRKKLVLTSTVDLPLYGKLKASEISKEELLELWSSVINKHKLKIFTQQKVVAITKVNNGFSVETNSKTYSSSGVIMAIGRRGSPRKLGVPGEELPHVMYKLIEAESYKNSNVLIVGGGDSAVEAAIALASQQDNTVTISYRRDEFVRLKEKNELRIKELIASGKVKAIFNSHVEEIRSDSVFLRQDAHASVELPNEFVFVFAGGELPGELLKKIGIKLRTNEVEVNAA